MKIVLDIPPEQAMARAQLCKRLGYDDCERLANRHDGGEERDEMLVAIENLRSALAESGFNPR
jgi:hypothetical protein